MPSSCAAHAPPATRHGAPVSTRAVPNSPPACPPDVPEAFRMTGFEATRAWADAQDANDPLRAYRNAFHIPPHAGGDSLYFCGNSLGLQPKSVRTAIEAELADWADLAVEAHFRGRSPWMHYHEYVRDAMALVVGAQPHEVVA